MIIFGVATSHATIQKMQNKRHHAHVAKAPQIDKTPHSVCDWIGPGARAVYRCGLADPPLVLTQNTVTPQRSCDWVGPGARAVYRCR
jgi:hypothetical protein